MRLMPTILVSQMSEGWVHSDLFKLGHGLLYSRAGEQNHKL